MPRSKFGRRDKAAAEKDEPTKAVGAPDKASEPPKLSDPPKAGDLPKAPESPKPASRFVGTVASSGTADSGSEPPPAGSKDEERDNLNPAMAVRHRRVSGRVVIILVVLLLAIGAAGGWYYKRHHSAATGRPATPSPKLVQADVALAGSLGIHAADLSGWTVIPGSTGDAVSPVTTTSAAGTAAAAKAATTMAGCLKVPAADVTRAFGGASTARTAASATPSYNTATPTGTSASSVVDVMRGPVAEHADFKTFSNPTLFVGCYQPYAQAMLPYFGSAAAPFTSVTVATTTVPVPSSSRVKAEGFIITRTGSGITASTTAVAIFGGRLQSTVEMTSTSVFPAATETSLVTALEGRVVGSLKK